MSDGEVALTGDDIWQALQEVKDPEIPVVSVVEMGIVRDIMVSAHAASGEIVRITITPTFAGCPALHVMREDIERRVRALGVASVSVETVLHPPWSSDWITEAGRRKLKTFGLAPPPRHGGNLPITFYEPVVCPYCASSNTAIKNTFGPTLCRAIYYCNDCQQPFEQFKAL